MNIRLATRADIPTLLLLMRGLAEYEDYIGTFAVTEEVLALQGFDRSPPDFYVLVADTGTELVGMVVYYYLPFTATVRPTLYIKEVFVTEAARGQQVGEWLMRRAAQEAVQHGCGAVQWTVADWNTGGQKFYERLGAAPNPVWIQYGLDGEALSRLAESEDNA